MSAPYQGLGPTLAECLTAEKIALTAELAQVKAELYEAINARCNCCGWIAGASPGPAEAGTQEGENA